MHLDLGTFSQLPTPQDVDFEQLVAELEVTQIKVHYWNMNKGSLKEYACC